MAESVPKRRRWLPVTIRICIRSGGFVLAVVGLVAGLFVGRLALGPIDLSWITPAMERWAAALPGGQDAVVGGLTLVWDGEDRVLAVRATDVSLRSATGDELARFPAADVGFSVVAALGGRLELTSVQLIAPRLEVVRGEDGAWRLAAAADESEPPAAGAAVPLPAILARLAYPGAADEDPLAGLSTVRVRQGTVVVRDTAAGTNWSVGPVDLALSRDRGGLTGDVDATIDTGETATVSAVLHLPNGGDAVEGTVQLSRLIPALLAAWLPEDSSAAPLLAAVDAPVDGEVWIVADLDGALRAAAVNLTLAAGSLSHAGIRSEPMPIRSGWLTGTWEGAPGRAQVETLAVRLGTASAPGPTLSVSGEVTEGGAGSLRVQGRVGVADVAMATLEHWWPAGLAADARPWVVENIPAGRVDGGRADFALRLDQGGAVALKDLRGSFDFAELTVYYRRPAPPVSGLTGTGSFDAQGLSFTANGGRLGDLTVGDVRIAITGLDRGDERIAIDHTVSGPIRSAMTLFQHPGLELLDREAIQPDQVDGSFTASVRLGFPLLAELAFADVELEASGTLRDASVREFFTGVSIAGGPFPFSADLSGLEITGPAVANGVPLDLVWRDSIVGAGPERRRIRVRVPRLDEAGRTALGIETAPFLTGAIAAGLDISVRTDGQSVVAIDAHLDEAEMVVPPLRWSKAKGVPGKAAATVRVEPGGETAIDRLDLTAGSLAVTGAVQLDTARTLRRASFDRLAFGRSDLKGVTVAAADGRLDIAISGGEIDARPFLTETEGEGEHGDAPTDVTIDAASLGRVVVGDGRALRDVSVQAVQSGDAWRSIRVRGRAGAAPGFEGQARDGASAFALDFGPPAATGRYPLRLEADSAGDLLYTLGEAEGIVGGRLVVNGETTGPSPTSPLQLSFVVTDVAYGQRAATRRALAAAGDVLAGDEQINVTRFDRLQGEALIDGKIVRLDSVAAYNDSLGLSGSGTLDLHRQTVAMEGAVVPARRLNRLVGSIPLIGDLFGGGEGFIAVQVSVSGPLADPVIATHTLRSLTPGFIAPLRRLFSGDDP